MCFILPFEVFSTVGSSTQSTVHKHWGVVFMSLLGSKSSMYPNIMRRPAAGDEVEAHLQG